jgi:meso-butanediol dehydrogenase/(S,S)-butanediol dehydrogenase/diacetyl reductase
MYDLRDQVALVTGAARGIGRGVAMELARVGAGVVVADIDLAQAEATVKDIIAMGAVAMPLRLDVTDQGSVTCCVQDAIQHFKRINILVNNAGVFQRELGLNQDERDFERGFGVNVTGIWRMVRALVPHFRAAGSGRIVNIASVGGRKGVAFAPGYCASKAAVINLSQSLAGLLGPDGINVNTVCPGAVAGAMQDEIKSLRSDQGSVGQPDVLPLAGPLNAEDVGYAVVFFASRQARHITGQALNVDCGYSMN